MKKLFVVTMAFLLIIVSTFACSGGKAVKPSEEGRIKIFVLTDLGNPNEMSEANYKARIITGEWMQNDLVRTLDEEGYYSIIIDNRDHYRPGPDNYLLEVTILSHHRISSATRFWVGRMAGADTITNHYKLTDANNKTFIDYKDGIGSTKSANHSARKLNQDIVRKIKELLGTKTQGS